MPGLSIRPSGPSRTAREARSQSRPMGLLSQNLTKAVGVLTTLLAASDNRLKRLAAKDILDFFVKHIEMKEFEERLATIEEKLQR